jgi:hypothetical protein
MYMGDPFEKKRPGIKADVDVRRPKVRVRGVVVTNA